MITLSNKPVIAAPIYFINTTPSNLLGAARYMRGLRFITANNCFEGRWDRVAFAAGPPAPGSNLESEVARILATAGADYRIRFEADANVMFLMFDERVESLASGLGLNVCLPRAEMRARLDDKVTGTRLAEAAGVPSVPNVLSPIGSYDDLQRRCSHLGGDLVIQLPFGDSGESTFFIRSEADFEQHAAAIEREPCVKVMKRIRCWQLTIEAVNTRCGTFVGPLMKELVGFSELTPRKGGWCGNELVSPDDGSLPASLRREAQHAAIAIGTALAEESYRGYFGIDFLLDEETGELYFGELNPRITGATPLSTQAALEEELPPLLVLHMLEWLGEPIQYDRELYNRRMLDGHNTQPMSSLIVKHLRADSHIVDSVPASGIWRMGEDGGLRFAREAFDPAELQGSDELFLLHTTDPGQIAPIGYCLVRAWFRGASLDSSYRLNAAAIARLGAIRNLISTSTLGMPAEMPAAA